jgi:hypothetical protein
MEMVSWSVYWVFNFRSCGCDGYILPLKVHFLSFNFHTSSFLIPNVSFGPKETLNFTNLFKRLILLIFWKKIRNITKQYENHGENTQPSAKINCTEPVSAKINPQSSSLSRSPQFIYLLDIGIRCSHPDCPLRCPPLDQARCNETHNNLSTTFAVEHGDVVPIGQPLPPFLPSHRPVGASSRAICSGWWVATLLGQQLPFTWETLERQKDEAARTGYLPSSFSCSRVSGIQGSGLGLVFIEVWFGSDFILTLVIIYGRKS